MVSLRLEAGSSLVIAEIQLGSSQQASVFVFPFLIVESGSTLKGCPTEQEKHMLHEEFLSVMQDKFMRGEEEEFDYSAVDTNDEYDDLTIRERDEEEHYFDSEEISSA